MPSRLGPRSDSMAVKQIPRQVSVPIVPDISTQQYGTCQKNIVKAMATEDIWYLEHSIILQQRNGLLESKKYDKNTKSLSNVLHVPPHQQLQIQNPYQTCYMYQPPVQ